VFKWFVATPRNGEPVFRLARAKVPGLSALSGLKKGPAKPLGQQPVNLLVPGTFGILFAESFVNSINHNLRFGVRREFL
jgi:hypothetical protein